MIWSYDYFLINEDEYTKEQQSGNKNMIRTGARYVDKYFLYTENGKARIEDNMNHSDNYNILYHCGICFATRDIKKGEELFVNYRYVLSKNDNAGFIDNTTGKYIDGTDGFTCLCETTKLLNELLNKVKIKSIT